MHLIARDLDAREERRTRQDEADDLWLRERAGIDPDTRRRAWRQWLCNTLEQSLQWPQDPVARQRLIGQCAAEITTLAQQLRGRGWLLEGKALAQHVRALLAPIAAAQHAGKVRDFWPYFGEAVSRYVGAHAEEIQAHARRTGADEGAQTMAGALAAFGLVNAPRKPPSLTEIVADRAVEIAAAKAAQRAAKASQMRLL